MKTYKYRLYPSRAQAGAIDGTIEKCRLLYNGLLALKKDTYKQNGFTLFRKDLYGLVRGNNEMHSQVSQNVCNRIDKAFKNFFGRIREGARKKGFPRFKKVGTYRSFTLPQIVNSEKIGEKTFFPKIGWINTRYHRKINGTPKTLTIKKEKSGKYFVTICCENVKEEVVKTSYKEVDLDVGLNNFVVTSDGEFFDHPKPMKRLAFKRKRLARNFSKTKKRSNNREKARTRLARTDEKIVNVRSDFGWKLCNLLVKKYGTICVEDLNIKRMLKNRYLAKSISDVSWADFLQKLSFKAESAGGKVVKVNPRNTSQKCSKCKRMIKKSLVTRIHECPRCGLEIDRDLNAARNILTLGRIGREPPELKPVGDEATTASFKFVANFVNESGSH